MSNDDSIVITSSLKSIEKTIKNKPLKKLQVETHLVEHCNLNCQMCTHYSPLADPRYADIESFSKDMLRLKELFLNEVSYIMLLGGEPLLHPNLIPFFEIARNCFPNTEIILYTNGLRLPRMNVDFWNGCYKNKITIVLTKYPIKFNYKNIETLILQHNIKYRYCNTPGRQKQSSHFPLDIYGKQDPYASFSSCSMANRCIFLRNGKLYTCSIAPNIHHFNAYFNQNLIVSEHDSIDIYSSTNATQIMQFLANPIPFCRYCDVQRHTNGHKWKKSKKLINEWT